MKVILVKPNKRAEVAEIKHNLESMQEAVGGYIEAIYPFQDAAAIICNDEGKLNGEPLNRALYDDNGDIYDIIAGTFFICGTTKDGFGSLSSEQIKKYTEMFLLPEIFMKINGKIIAAKIEELAL